jgi:oligosaccharide repeat unit polymerase
MHGFFMVLSAYFLTNLDTISRSSEIRKLLKFAIGGVLLILLLYVSVIIRENLTGLSPWGYVREAFRGFYLYITGPLVAFSQIFEIGSLSKYFGAYTFGGIYRLINILENVIGLSDMFESPPKPYMFIPQPFNTYPHLWFFYSDFGFAGTLITMWIMGWFFSYIYLKYRLRKTLSLLIVNILLFDYLLITPRDTATFWISFWFTLALSWFSAKCVEQRTRVRSNSGGNYAHNS